MNKAAADLKSATAAAAGLRDELDAAKATIRTLRTDLNQSTAAAAQNQDTRSKLASLRANLDDARREIEQQRSKLAALADTENKLAGLQAEKAKRDAALKSTDCRGRRAS